MKDFNYLFLQQLKNPANLQFLILFCYIPMQWAFLSWLYYTLHVVPSSLGPGSGIWG